MPLNSFISRIGHFVSSPRQMPHKIKKKYRYYRALKNFNPSLLVEEQNLAYSRFGVSRDAGCARKIELQGSLNAFTEIDDSEHTTFFAALSISKPETIKRILEIGTYDAKNAKLLSNLFPQAEIVTLELPDDDPIFINSYRRNDPELLKSFIKDRNEVLASCSNVKAVQRNSLALSLDQKGEFDLIWVDGAHGYPVVAIDIANSLRLLAKGGIMTCDDVWTKIETEDSMYKSCATYETLLAFQHAKIIRFGLISKRLDFESAGNPFHKEYIAVVERL